MSVMVTAVRCSSAGSFTYMSHVYTHYLKLLKIPLSLHCVNNDR